MTKTVVNSDLSIGHAKWKDVCLPASFCLKRETAVNLVQDNVVQSVFPRTLEAQAIMWSRQQASMVTTFRK